jgi:hypothetical protein
MIARKHILPKIIEQVWSSQATSLSRRRVGVYYNRKPIYAERGGCAYLKWCLEIIHTKLNLYSLSSPEKYIREEHGDGRWVSIHRHENVVELLVKNESMQTQSFCLCVSELNILNCIKDILVIWNKIHN